MLDYRMETFLSLCETQSYTKTAEALHLTQPSVTQHIKYLEHYYQCDLFRYTGKHVEMTPAGQYLRDKVALQRVQNVEIRKRLQRMQDDESYSIGLTPSATFSFVLPRLCAYVNRSTTPQVALHVANTETLLRDMQNGTLDAIIMEGELPNLPADVTELCREKIVAAASPALAKTLYGCSWKALLQQPLVVLQNGCGIRTLVQRHLGRSGVSLYDFAEVIEVDSFTVLKEILRQGKGIAFVLEATICREQEEKRLVRVYTDTLPMTGSLYFVTMRKRADNAGLFWIRDMLLQK